MKRISLIIISIVLLSAVVSTTSLIFAAEDQFIVSVQVDDSPDVAAPTIPTGLSATAVSASQIDLVWNVSTDDTAVTDYLIYRNNVFLALSGGLTSYSDSGLSPNTLYTYTVSAIDAANNESARSASSSATTFSDEVIPPDTGPGSGSASFILEYLTVSPDLREAVITFGTNVPVRASVYWGLTRDLELGGSASDMYRSNHTVRLTDLEPGTQYFFRIELIDGRGLRKVIDHQDFYTLSLPDATPPDNITNFRATERNGDVLLTWRNPHADFEKVRIVKSTIFYPRDPSEGEVIYEGRAEEFVDEEVEAGKRYYYSAFAIDGSGNYSSGAVTDVRLSLEGEVPGTPQLFAGVLQLPKDLIDPLLKSFSIWDINFIQDGVKKPIVSNSVEIRGDRSLTISIDYDKMPEILKTIAITMFDPNDKEKTFSFLLRINKDKTAYEANLAALERPGTYEFAFAVLDYKHQGLVSLTGEIIARIPEVLAEENGFVSRNYWWWLLIILTLLVIWYVYRNHRKAEVVVVLPENTVK